MEKQAALAVRNAPFRIMEDIAFSAFFLHVNFLEHGVDFLAQTEFSRFWLHA